jgi:transketolase
MNARRIRRIILEQSHRAHVGHIGCALSVADIIAALYGGVLNIDDPADSERDRFVMSKGHAALALYAALHLKGWLTQQQLDSFCTDGSLLGVHPEEALTGVDFATGSLGHGLSMAVGAALAARLQRSSRRAFVLLSDAECNEGSVWEAAMFAAHHKLSNLVAVIDLNGQQALGNTKDVLDLSPLANRWREFGWHVVELDAVESSASDRIATKLNERDTSTGAPTVLIARTRFGQGVSFMQNQVKWHYWPMDDDEFTRALKEVDAS